MNPTPEKRAHKPFKASRKKASKPLEFTGEKVPRKTDQSFRPFSAPAEPSPPLAQASESAAANSAQPKQSEAGQPDCGLHQARSSPHDPVEDNTFEPVDDADGFVASTSRFPPPSEPPNQEDRRHGEEENWGAIRSEAQRRYVETFHSREQFLSTSMTASRCFWQQTVEERPASCPRCGEGGTLEPEGNRAAVLYVTQLHRFVLQVPLFLCSGCGQRTHAHPLSAHAFPGTPKWGFQLSLSLGSQRVPTWYSLDLLELYDSLTFNGKRGVVSLESFCAAIKGIHEKHGCTEPPLPADTFRKGFGKAWEEMGYIWHAAHDMRTFGVDGFEASPFASCAPCQGASPDQPLHSVYGDACFKIKHLARAGAASAFRKPHIQDNTFIPDNAVKAFLDIRESAVSAGESTCSEFKADSVYGAANPSIYDIPGYMGLFCRHGILGLGANVFGGERYGHPTLLLLTLLAVYGIPVQFFWYDIGCRYKIHVAAWLALQSPAIFPIANAVLAFSVMMQLARAITVVVPPFHQYAHSAACQAENSGKHAEGSGRASGEPPENAWSFFGTFNKVLQSRSLASRADFMSRLRGCYNEQRASSLPELLVRMNTKAQLQVEAAAAEILRISGEAVAAGIRLDEVMWTLFAHSLTPVLTAAPRQPSIPLFQSRRVFVRI